MLMLSVIVLIVLLYSLSHGHYHMIITCFLILCFYLSDFRKRYSSNAVQRCDSTRAFIELGSVSRKLFQVIFNYFT